MGRFGAGLDPFEKQVVRVVCGEDDDVSLGQVGADLPRGRDAAQAAHQLEHEIRRLLALSGY